MFFSMRYVLCILSNREPVTIRSNMSPVKCSRLPYSSNCMRMVKNYKKLKSSTNLTRHLKEFLLEFGPDTVHPHHLLDVLPSSCLKQVADAS